MQRQAVIKRFIAGAVFGLAGLTGISEQAQAGDVVYSQAPLFENGNSFPAEINGGQQADDWVANTSSPINLFRWWGTEAGPGANTGSFTLRVYSNSGGLPASLLNSIAIGNAYTRTATGQSDFNGRDIFKYEADIGSFNPTLSATYWLSIVNDVSVSGSPGFLWHQGSGPNNSHAFRVGAGSWNTLDGDMAFELVSIPGPGVLAMLSLAAACPRRRRR